MRSAWGLVVVAACASTPPYARDIAYGLTCHDMPRRVGEPSSLASLPWRVGQWARYRTRLGGQIVVDHYHVLAIDSCGTWIERTTETADHRWSWVFCFRERPTTSRWVREAIAAEIETLDHERPRLVSAPFAPDVDTIVSGLLPPTWLATGADAREDVDVVAGHFAGVVRGRSAWEGHGSKKLTVWAHPYVPFDGVVKIVSDDGSYEQELVELGEDVGTPSPVSELVMAKARSETPPLRPYLEVDFGFTWLTRHTSADSSFGERMNVGAPLTPALDGELSFLTTWGTSAADPSLDVSAISATAGARWTFSRWGDLSAYVRGGIGYIELDRYMNNMDAGAAHGLALEAGGGVVRKISHDWNIRLELSDTVGIYDANEGTRHLVTLGWGLQLIYP